MKSVRKVSDLYRTLSDNPDYPESLMRKLGWSRDTLYRKLNELISNGLVEKSEGTYPIFYSLTKEGKKESVRFFSYGMRKKEVHDLYITIPILKKSRLPKGFWDKINTKLKNNIQKFKLIKKPFRISFRETSKKVCIQCDAKDLKNIQDLISVVMRLIIFTYDYFKKHGYILNPFEASVSNLHIVMPDPNVEKLIKNGVKVRVPLKRKRAKFFRNDPDQDAYVEGCPTPKPCKESNDYEYARKELLMPETVHDLREMMGTVVYRDTYMFNTQVKITNTLEEMKKILKFMATSHTNSIPKTRKHTRKSRLQSGIWRFLR